MILLGWIAWGAYSQNKVVRTYYDLEQKVKKEEYRVNDQDTTILDGLYKVYYQNGRLKTVGYYTNNQATDYWEYFYQNGNLKSEGLINNYFQEGYWIYYYENGQKSAEGKMEKGKKHGFWRNYYEDGTLKSEGLMARGALDGDWKYYYQDGTLKGRARFKKDRGKYMEYFPSGVLKMEGLMYQGKSDSLWKYYYPSGKLKAQGMEVNGLREGNWVYYYENGNPSSEGGYKAGETVGPWKYYYENGALKSEGIEERGQKEGEWNLYYESGAIKGKGTYHKGNGTYTEYYPNGKVKVKGAFSSGKCEGPWEYLYESGEKEGYCMYANGEGWYTGYYPDGSKKMEGLLKEGAKIGVWKLYKKDGTIAGYYKSFVPEEEEKDAISDSAAVKEKTPVPKAMNSKFISPAANPAPPVPKAMNSKSHTSSYKGKRKSTSWVRKIHLYRPDPNLYKTFILSVGPFSSLIGEMPFFVEYYVQESWGVEFGAGYIRKPFYNSFANVRPGQIFVEGQSAMVRYKRYFANDEFIGRPYLGGMLKCKRFGNSTLLPDSTLGQSIQLTKSEQVYELMVLGGDRFMKNFDASGVTLDISFGLGGGYRTFLENFDNPEYNQYFDRLAQSPYYVAFLVKLSLGYAF